MKENPKLTIITINLNNKDGLRKTIKSVVVQTTHEFEYIVIDGGSTDGSVEVIKEYEEYIDYWVSEPDKGIYNAMNKGVQKAHGEFCQFLNSGDWLYSNIVVECMLPYFDLDRDIWIGNITLIKDNKIVKCHTNAPKELTLCRLIDYHLPHQAIFIKTGLLIDISYNESLKMVSDWEFFINAYLSDAKFGRIPFDIAYFNLEGISSTRDIREECLPIRDTLVHPEVYNEIKNMPSEIIYLFNQIPYSYKLQKMICAIDKLIVKIYSAINRNSVIKSEKYVNYPPQFC